MSKRRTGRNPLAYLGVEALMPPEMYNETRAPTANDFRGKNIGDFWNVTDPDDPNPLQLWVLLSVANMTAQWFQLYPGQAIGAVIMFQAGDNTVANPFAGRIVFPNTTNISSTAVGNDFFISLNNSIILPASSADGTSGVIYIGGIPMMQALGTRNIFLGDAGNFTLITAFATDNVGIGAAALSSLNDGSLNVAVGSSAGASITDGLNNVLLGTAAGTSMTTADQNVAVGSSALGAAVTSHDSTAIGFNSLILSTGSQNTALGSQTAQFLTTGATNIFIGANSGSNYTGAESSNILINSRGLLGESNALRIGVSGVAPNQVNTANIAGIYNRAFGSPSGVVQIDSTDRLGSSAGIDGQLLIGATGASPAWRNITSRGGSIAVTNDVNAINLEAVGGGAPTVTVAFLYNFTPDQANQTGDGTVVTIGATQALTFVYDVGGNTTLGGVFTAPITAKYYLELTIELIGLTAGAANCQLATVQIVTTSETFEWQFSPAQAFYATGNDEGTFSFQQVCAMSLGDTAYFTVACGPSAGGGAKDIGIGDKTFISGFLVSGAGMGTVGLHANDGNTAQEAAGIINVYGDTVNVTTTGGIDNTLTIELTGFTDHAMVVGTAAGKLNSLAAAPNGFIPIGSTGANPIVAPITGGTGISVVNGAGSITVNAVGGAVTWQIVAINTVMVPNNGYITDAAGTLTMTLPAVIAVGDVIRVAGFPGSGAGGNISWSIAQQAGQSIAYGNQITTIGAGGSLTATESGDAVEILCIGANSSFMVLSSIGNITVV